MHEIQETFANHLNDNMGKKTKSNKKCLSTPKLNAYTMFIKERRPETQSRNPTLKPKEVIAMLAAEWRNMSEDEKDLFKVLAEEENRKTPPASAILPIETLEVRVQ